MSLADFMAQNNNAPIQEVAYTKDGKTCKFLRIGVKSLYCKPETIDFMFDESLSYEERLNGLQYMECRKDTPEEIARGEQAWVPCICKIGGTVTRSFGK